MSTKKLYENDAYAKEFTATVVSCEETEKKGYALVLDQTLFFPEEGGQSPDTGILTSEDGSCRAEVTDVQIKKDLITHYVSQAFAVGSKVKGELNWQHRFYNMQQHSGEHIFSGLVHKYFGYDNVGFHLSDQIVTMDFNGVLTMEDAAKIEYEVNEAIANNVDVVVSYPSKEELAGMDYRSKIEIDGQVRIVTITGYDVCACCAPHVKRTGEIGGLKLMSLSNYKGGVRISILCGFRALEAFREKSDVITDLTSYLTTGQDKLVETVKKLKTTNQSLSSQLAKAKEELLNYKLSGIPADQENVILFEQGLDNKVARNVLNDLIAKHPGICGIFMGDDQEGYNYILGSASADCRTYAGLFREKLGAKGGGNEKMVQGSMNATKAEIEALL